MPPFSLSLPNFATYLSVHLLTSFTLFRSLSMPLSLSIHVTFSLTHLLIFNFILSVFTVLFLFFHFHVSSQFSFFSYSPQVFIETEETRCVTKIIYKRCVTAQIFVTLLLLSLGIFYFSDTYICVSVSLRHHS